MSNRLKLGEKAPHFTAQDWKDKTIDLGMPNGRIVLLCFFRYASCPLCNLRVQELIRAHEQLNKLNVSIVAVFQSPMERIAHYVGRQEPPFPIIPDPQLKLYRLYGVETSWFGFFRAWTVGLGKVVQAVIGKGFLPGTVENELNRIPADFLISHDGRLVDVYYGKDIGDHVPLSQIFDGLKASKEIQRK